MIVVPFRLSTISSEPSVSPLSSTTQHTTPRSESPLTFFLLFCPLKNLFLCLCGANFECSSKPLQLPFRGRGRAGSSRLMRTAYSRTLCLPCPAQGQGFCALRPFIMGIWLLKPGFALLLYTPLQLATNALTRRSGAFPRYFPDPCRKLLYTGHTWLNTALTFLHLFHLLQIFAACPSL